MLATGGGAKVLADSAVAIATGLSRVGELRRRLTRLFARRGLPDPGASAKYLLAHCMGEKTLTEQHSRLDLTESQRSLLASLCSRRLQREPLQYILGEWDFRDVNLIMREPVFIPRPETEKLVDLAKTCALSPDSAGRHWPEIFCEIGTGSGAVTACLLRELPQSHCLAVELLPQACQLTLENCSRLGVADRLHLVNASLATPGLLGAAPALPLIVSNPPYVPEACMARLQPEVRRESPLALRGGDGDVGGDGLGLVRRLMQFADARLLPGGWLVLEIDSSQGGRFRRGPAAYGSLQFASVETDFAGKDRFCLFRKSPGAL